MGLATFSLVFCAPPKAVAHVGAGHVSDSPGMRRKGAKEPLSTTRARARAPTGDPPHPLKPPDDAKQL
eukprot:4089262-Prymnesium_polylepis.1